MPIFAYPSPAIDKKEGILWSSVVALNPAQRESNEHRLLVDFPFTVVPEEILPAAVELVESEVVPEVVRGVVQAVVQAVVPATAVDPAEVELVDPAAVELVDPAEVELVDPAEVELVDPAAVELVDPVGVELELVVPEVVPEVVPATAWFGKW
ncbi:hypothetical protein PSTG_04251 [Puccinia striiformis f. sp. tritici PST-78]|uniref:Uncharacterized protein n=1 Tax=Puccinia striiformis f. sp. tritici PST-78 TaxID=1165861 RepID=A0A0L0VTP4_9BASI|nr:hypothetical protein PSTG_04251 [Puccinia striiformis f. sp. tritici PST-78]